MNWRSLAPTSLVGEFSSANKSRSLSNLAENIFSPKRRRDSCAVIEAGQGQRAKPQIVTIDGRAQEVWAEHWGITSHQFRRFLDECQQDIDWSDDFTIGEVVKRYVKPKTRGTGLGYALLVNAQAPKKVLVMISHAWGENALDFLHTLERSVDHHDALFICALSLYQCEDGVGPTIAEQLGCDPYESPFCRVLDHIREEGEEHGCLWRSRALIKSLPWVFATLALTCLFMPVLLQGCVPMQNYCAVGTCVPLMSFLPVYAWTWTFEPLEGMHRIFVRIGHVLGVCAILMQIGVVLLNRSKYWYRGGMVAVPNHNVEMYTRLWCVYEMFVAEAFTIPVRLARTLASVGPAASKEAKCSSQADRARINGQIEERGVEAHGDPNEGYKMVDRAIARISRTTLREAVTTEVLWGWPLALALMCCVRLVKKGLVTWWEEQVENASDRKWYERVRYLASHGRLGYDLYCAEVFEASEHAFWAWGLVLGVLLGYVLVIGLVVHVARKMEGRTTFGTWLRIAGVFLACEISFNVLAFVSEHMGLCSWHPHRANWFVLGLTAALAQGSSIILLFLCMKILQRTRCGCSSVHHVHMARAQSYVAAAILVGLMLATCRLDTFNHYYPTLVFNSCMLFGTFLGPLALASTAALRWGVTIRDSVGISNIFDYNEDQYSASEYSASSDESS